jgi:hypothetical protein
MLQDIRQHDLTPLASLLSLNVNGRNIPQPKFTNLGGTRQDYIGSDIKLEVGDNWEFFIQDKFRTSLVGSDLGIEFCRMYLFENGQIILDGGRDLYQQSRTPIKFIFEESIGIRRAMRDWPRSRTVCDLFLLHAKGVADFIWMKAEPAKNIARQLTAKWFRRFPDVESRVETEVFGNERTLSFNELMESDMDIKCLREHKDTKRVVGPDGTVKTCCIAKTIVYIPFATFAEGTEWVRTTRNV